MSSIHVDTTPDCRKKICCIVTKCFSIHFYSFRLSMPTDSNESLISSSSTTTTIVVPLTTTMNTNNGSTLVSNSSLQLHKLKRFLSTLYHFGSDISNEIGERVRALILALVVSFVLFFSISILLYWISNRVRMKTDDSFFFVCWTRCLKNEIKKKLRNEEGAFDHNRNRSIKLYLSFRITPYR